MKLTWNEIWNEMNQAIHSFALHRTEPLNKWLELLLLWVYYYLPNLFCEPRNITSSLSCLCNSCCCHLIISVSSSSKTITSSGGGPGGGPGGGCGPSRVGGLASAKWQCSRNWESIDYSQHRHVTRRVIQLEPNCNYSQSCMTWAESFLNGIVYNLDSYNIHLYFIVYNKYIFILYNILYQINKMYLNYKMSMSPPWILN